KSESADMIMPGVQYPHCIAPTSRNANCRGWRFRPSARLSMVRIFLSWTVPTRVLHDRMLFPSTNTLHAPHRPSPQAYLQPVSPRSSRKTLNKLRSSSAFTARRAPLTLSSLMLGMFSSGANTTKYGERLAERMAYHSADHRLC